MPDVFSQEKRSQVMSRIRWRGNRDTEQRLVRLFREAGIKGWRRHLPLPGCPDFAFPKLRIAVFVDGCFWHGCPKHFSPPVNRAGFWAAKIGGNRKRDRRVTCELRARGWLVVRIWEHDLTKKKALRSVARVKSALARRASER